MEFKVGQEVELIADPHKNGEIVYIEDDLIYFETKGGAEIEATTDKIQPKGSHKANSSNPSDDLNNIHPYSEQRSKIIWENLSHYTNGDRIKDLILKVLEICYPNSKSYSDKIGLIISLSEIPSLALGVILEKEHIVNDGKDLSNEMVNRILFNISSEILLLTAP